MTLNRNSNLSTPQSQEHLAKCTMYYLRCGLPASTYDGRGSFAPPCGYIKPRGKVDYTELGFEAGVKAMLDAHINYDDVDQGVACYCYGDSTCGQRVFYQFGMTQIPIFNVNNNCSTGSTGLYIARNMIS